MHKLYDDQPEERQDETQIERARARSYPSRLRLVVMLGEGGNTTYPLPVAGELVIGRGSGCTIRIDDAKLSRKHAVLRIGNQLELMDLGSANGTRVGDRQLVAQQPTVIAPGEMLAFGSIMAVIQASTSAQLRHLWTHAHFQARLEDECTRAAETKRQFAVLRMNVGEQAALVESTLDQWMRPMDILAAYSPHEWEFLLVDASPEEADAIVTKARALLGGLGGPVEIGIATYPAAGRTPEKLIAAAGRFRSPAEAVAEAVGIRVQAGYLEKMRPLIERVASGTISVLITGETGAGKEVLAHTIHRLSPRASAPMVCLNCAAFSETLLESELFGHERGAFTGATQSKPGLLESADGGTVFLDEIGEMPTSLQVKLLRVIQERQVQRVGGLKPRSINVRFVSATNRDLEAEVLRGAFRQDLFYRLNGVVLMVPPLRDRKDEIEPLARAFVSQFAEQLGARQPRLSPEVLQVFQSHPWPGNVRELRNVIERAILLCTGDEITMEHVPQERPKADAAAKPRTPPPVEGVTLPPASVRSLGAGPDTPTLQGIQVLPDSIERARVVAALDSCAGNQTQAARLLGISRNTLIARLNQYELARPRKRD